MKHYVDKIGTGHYGSSGNWRIWWQHLRKKKIHHHHPCACVGLTNPIGFVRLSGLSFRKTWLQLVSLYCSCRALQDLLIFFQNISSWNPAKGHEAIGWVGSFSPAGRFGIGMKVLRYRKPTQHETFRGFVSMVWFLEIGVWSKTHLFLFYIQFWINRCFNQFSFDRKKHRCSLQSPLEATGLDFISHTDIRCGHTNVVYI